MIPVDLLEINGTYRGDNTKLRLTRRIALNPKYPNMVDDVPVKPDEFLDILKLAYPGCTVEYKQQTRLDGTEESAFFISW
jgi:hypothetical protein